MNAKSRYKNINKPFWLASLLVILAMILAACSPAATATPEPTAPPAPTNAPAPTNTAAPAATATVEAKAPANEATINIATDTKYGKILVDGKGMTLYMYTKDEPNKTNCNEGCLKAWPPLLTLGAPKLGDGVDASLVGTADMANGSKIVTYNKMPLYYWVKDTKAGDTTGIGVGGVWYVVSPAGKVVGMEASINLATDAKYGKILTDAKGMTLYMYTKDEANKSNCNEGCLKAWPPLLTYGAPKLGDGVDASLVGTADLADGSKIVTYNKMPLYYWVKDTKPGDTTGIGVGGVWYVVSNDGKIVGVEATINIANDAKFGKILVDGKGMTLYMYTKDEANKSNCNAACLKNWPPVLTSGTPKLGENVDASLIGTADLADGSKIVTYNKMPLYYWVKDTKPGDTTGVGVGNVWYVVSNDGKVVGQDVTINIATDPKLGKILVDGKGMTLYIYTKDTANKSTCNAGCLANWPPFVTSGKPTFGAGVDDSLIGTATLDDGRLIVTYNKMPLYYFVKDTKPGDTTGEGVGNVWYVISPDGKIVSGTAKSDY
jgi:predicted lipoprotein with Yx(FWY)xxD motif